MMKKKKLIIIIILIILGILLVLSFVKLPVSVISKEKINEISNNKLELTLIDKQYFKLLPTPNLALEKAIFNFNYNNMNSDIVTDKIEINRSLFNGNNHSIFINKILIQDLGIDLRNLKIDLSKNSEKLNILTNKFSLNESKIKLDITTKNKSLDSVNFNLENLELQKGYELISKLLNINLDKNIINQILLSDKIYIKSQGVYGEGQLIINSGKIIISEDSTIELQGTINLNDPKLSSIEVELNNIDSNFIKSLGIVSSIYSSLPEGKIVSSKIVIEEGLINLKSMEYLSTNGNSMTIKSTGPIKDIKNPNLEIAVKINDFKELGVLINKLPIVNIDILLGIADVHQGNISLIIKNSFLEINQINLETKENEKLLIQGDYDLNNKSFENLVIELKDISRLKIKKMVNVYMNDYQRQYLELLEFDNVNASISLSRGDKLFLITKLELINKDSISRIEGLYQDKSFAGSIDLKNLDLKLIDNLFLDTKRLEGFMNLEFESNGLISINNIINTEGFINGIINIKINDNEIALLNFLQSLAVDVEDLEAFKVFSQILTKSFINKSIQYKGNITNPQLNEFIINDLIFLASDGEKIKTNILIKGKDFDLILTDVFEDEDFLLSRKNSFYSFKRKNAEGIITKPVEELIKKNLNKLFENLLN